MVLFYSDNIHDNIAYFQGDELKHILQSMRKMDGDIIDFVDGKGKFYRGVVSQDGKKTLVAHIIETREDEIDIPQIHLAVAPTKNQDRIEWFVEKAVELGISEISFILCKHSERKTIKDARIDRIAIAAMKQSLKARKPVINSIVKWEEWVDKTAADQSFVASLHEGSQPLHAIYDCNKSVRICVGPEGGFRDTEIEHAIANGFLPISLGNQRLRTETAALVSVAACHTIYQMK